MIQTVNAKVSPTYRMSKLGIIDLCCEKLLGISCKSRNLTIILLIYFNYGSMAGNRDFEAFVWGNVPNNIFKCWLCRILFDKANKSIFIARFQKPKRVISNFMIVDSVIGCFMRLT